MGYSSGLIELPSALSFPNGYGIIDHCIDTNFNCNLLTATKNIIQQNIDIYPNPTKEVLNLKFIQVLAGTIQLFSTAGKSVYFAEFQGLTHQISIPNLPKGIYFLHLQSDEGYLVQKVSVL